MSEREIHTLVEAAAERLAQLADVREVAPRLEHIRKEDELFQLAHVRPARGVVADGVEHGGVRDAEGMLGEVCPRILMQDGRGNVLLGRNKARKLGRGEVEVLRRVVQGGVEVRVLYYEYYVYQHGFEPVHIFGATGTGADLFTLVASGTQFSFLLAIGVSIVNLIIGAIYGAIEGFYGGKIDLVMERIADILNGVPFMIVAVLLNMHFAETLGVVGALIFAFVLTGWIGTAATVRMQFYRYKKQEYVLAARTLGARDRRLIMKHIYPNALGTIITSAALYIPSVIFSETSLAYLGIINLNNPSEGLISLGSLLTTGQSAISLGFVHIMLFPAIVIALLMISFNLFGNGLRDAFNPSLRGADS